MNSKHYSHVITLLFCFISAAAISQTPTDIPAFVRDTFFIDYSSDSGGDGSFNNPWKKISDASGTYHNGQVWIYNNAAILFKKGITHGELSEIKVVADSVYLGAYGTGNNPKLLFNTRNTAFLIEGYNNKVSNIHVHNLDTVYYSAGAGFGGSGDRNGSIEVDSFEVSSGYRGIKMGNLIKGTFTDIYVHHINHDAVYANSCDTLIFMRYKAYDINRDWLWDRAGTTSGGDMIQAEGVKGDRMGVLIVDSSYFDYSLYGGKFAIIANYTDTTIIRNTTFIGHPDTQTALRAGKFLFENNKVYGFMHALWNIGGGHTVVRNNIFVGFGIGFTFDGIEMPTPYLRGNYAELYNNVIMETDRVFHYPTENINTRNNIYYNVHQVFFMGARTYHGSRDIYWNTEGNQHSFERYDTSYREIIADPLFVDPNINWKEHVEVPGTGNGAWTWYEITNFPNLRLQKGSPAIDSADERVWSNTEKFVFGENETNNWGESDQGDIVYNRTFTGANVSFIDLAGNIRPNGKGYDIGPYEYGSRPLGVRKPEYTITANLKEFKETGVGYRSSEQSYAISASNLNSPWKVIPTNGFEVSLASETGYTSNFLVIDTLQGGKINTNVYVRFAPESSGTFSGFIKNQTRTINASIAVSGTGNSIPDLGELDNIAMCNTNNSLTVMLSVSDENPAGVSLNATSDNQALLPDDRLTISGYNNTLSLELNPLNNQSGSANIEVIAEDELGLKDTVSFTLDVPNAPLQLTTTVIEIACNGELGNVSLSGTGGTGKLEYRLNQGAWQPEP
ncbi:MAG TPA: hypothetical protein VJ951_04330, partial [Bacteroidales bacterium]|nr:hypothetical protein [Bacteroidales bacterium]